MSGQIITGAEVGSDREITCDVCVIGSGAGGAVLAAGLVERGYDVVMLEEGAYRTRKDWIALEESISYPMLYQERGTRTTADTAINVLQGRSVGGSTTVNWTTCFRTPDRILEHWAEHFGLPFDAQTLNPHWDAVEARLNIHQWPDDQVNANNDVLRRGCVALGYQYTILRRNVNGCVSSGYCGVGCPVNGKQAMHLTYLPDAIAGGMRLFADTRAERLEVSGHRVLAVHASVLHSDRDVPVGPKITVHPKVVALCGGAVNNPALLLRSEINPNAGVGARTFLHPVVALPGIYDEPIAGWYGAPQSVSSHEFIDRGADKMGFFLEVPPMQPMLAAGVGITFGQRMNDVMGRLEHTSGMIALAVDGLMPGDVGGMVTITASGRPKVHYNVNTQLVEAFRAAHVEMARIHFAAGAREVQTSHLEPLVLRSEADLSKLEDLPYGAHEHPIFTAHQMGGCSMGAHEKHSIVGPEFKMHGFDNVFVVDGSVLPTALGVNPSLTIYGLSHYARDFVASAV